MDKGLLEFLVTLFDYDADYADTVGPEVLLVRIKDDLTSAVTDAARLRKQNEDFKEILNNWGY